MVWNCNYRIVLKLIKFINSMRTKLTNVILMKQTYLILRLTLTRIFWIRTGLKCSKFSKIYLVKWPIHYWFVFWLNQLWRLKQTIVNSFKIFQRFVWRILTIKQLLVSFSTFFLNLQIKSLKINSKYFAKFLK